MSKKKTFKKILLSIYHYFSFFILMSFIISCCMLLFLTTMSETMGIVLTEKNIRSAAILTFGNVVLLSLIFAAIDAIRRKLTVDRHVKSIVSAAEKLAEGDYSVRIKPLRGINRADGLDEIIECFNKMAKELSGTEALRSDFIANVSHELKTPLAVMQNYASLLQSPDITEEDSLEYAKCISETTNRLAALITNILKLNKLENQQIYPSATTYNLDEQLCECLLAFESIWENKKIEIETDIDGDIKINADRELLSLVWNNLFSNALKFTDNGGKVSVSLKAQDNYAVISVTDTGCGITPEVGKHIFEKFYQGDTSHATQGNGLGLALVHRVVDIIGGDIAVTSAIGVGSTFTVKIRRSDNGNI